MIIDGKSKVGSAKVYASPRELELEKENDLLKNALRDIVNSINESSLYYGDAPETFDLIQGEYKQIIDDLTEGT